MIKDEDESFMIVSPFKDDGGCYRESDWGNEQRAKKTIGASYGGDVADLKEGLDEGWQIVDIFYQPFKPFEVGQKVKILESIKDTEDWKDYSYLFPKMEGIIKSIYSTISSGAQYKVESDDGTLRFSHQYLIPLVDEEETTIVLGKKYSKAEVEKRMEALKPIE